MGMDVVMAGQRVLAHGLGWRSVVDHTAVAEHHRAVDQRLQRAELMEDEEDRGAGGDLLAEGPREDLLAGEVDPAIGWSMISSSGSPARARAISTRWC
ncbi:hypothetical protein SANTM175S_07162 [Streptomyces antimycoticus]